MKYAWLLGLLVLFACDLGETQSAILPDVSLSTWSQVFVGPPFGPVEIQWTTSGGSPNNTASAVWTVDALFQVTASDSSTYDLHIARGDYYGPAIVHNYTDYLDIGGRQAVEVVLLNWRMR